MNIVNEKISRLISCVKYVKKNKNKNKKVHSCVSNILKEKNKRWNLGRGLYYSISSHKSKSQVPSRARCGTRNKVSSNGNAVPWSSRSDVVSDAMNRIVDNIYYERNRRMGWFCPCTDQSDLAAAIHPFKHHRSPIPPTMRGPQNPRVVTMDKMWIQIKCVRLDPIFTCPLAKCPII